MEVDTDNNQHPEEKEIDEDLEEEDDDDAEESDSSDDEPGEDRTYLPGERLEEGEELEIDENAYIVYHQASLGPPCLSFDVIPDQCKFDFPLSVTAVAGSQAAKVTANSIIVFRMSNMHSVRPVGEDEDEDDVDEPEEEKPVMK